MKFGEWFSTKPLGVNTDHMLMAELALCVDPEAEIHAFVNYVPRGNSGAPLRRRQFLLITDHTLYHGKVTVDTATFGSGETVELDLDTYPLRMIWRVSKTVALAGKQNTPGAQSKTVKQVLLNLNHGDNYVSLLFDAEEAKRLPAEVVVQCEEFFKVLAARAGA